MKGWSVRILFLIILGAAFFWIWHWFFATPEHLVRKKLSELAKAASISPNEAPLVKLARARRVANLFSSDAQVIVDIPGRSVQTFNGREEVQQAALGARALLNTLKVEFVDVTVAVGSDKNSAVAHLTATASLPGEKIPEVQELELGFTNMDHAWLINRVQTIRTLR